MPSPKSHHMCDIFWSGWIPQVDVFKWSSSVVELCCAVASQMTLIGPEKRVTREGRSSIHVDQECFKCSLLGGKPLKACPLRGM